MKPRELLYMLGLRPKHRHYGHDTIELADPNGGPPLRWVRWAHPKSRDLRPDLDELALLRRFLREGDFAIDVGAHVGDTTLPMALAVGGSGLVIAMEPNPATFEILELNAAANPGRTRIDCLNAAAMDQEGEFEFHYNDPGLTNGGYQKDVRWWQHASFFAVKVKGIRLESLVREHHAARIPRLRYIKTDCEGYDDQVIRSINGLVAQARPVMRIEVNRYLPQDRLAAFHADLRALDYRLFHYAGFVDGRRDEIDPRAPVKLPETIDVLALPRERAESILG